MNSGMLMSPPSRHPAADGHTAAGCSPGRCRMLEDKKNPAHFSSCVPLALVHLHEAAGVPGAPASPGSDRTPGSGGPAPVTVRCHIQQFWKLLPRAFAILQYIIFMKCAF